MWFRPLKDTTKQNSNNPNFRNWTTNLQLKQNSNQQRNRLNKEGDHQSPAHPGQTIQQYLIEVWSSGPPPNILKLSQQQISQTQKSRKLKKKNNPQQPQHTFKPIYTRQQTKATQGQPTPHQTKGWVFILQFTHLQTPWQTHTLSLCLTEASIAQDHHQNFISAIKTNASLRPRSQKTITKLYSFQQNQCTAKTLQKVKGPKWLKDAWGQAHQKVKGVKWSKF